jgi:quercetin dioxygenase-like cupin family protein
MLAEKGRTAWPDPVMVAGDVYKLLLENERVRVFDVRFKPGQKAVMHGHPDHVVYIVVDGLFKLSFPDGKSQEVPLKAGQAIFMAAGPHETTNLGTKEAHNLVIELK